jgi:hypothetical protein
MRKQQPICDSAHTEPQMGCQYQTTNCQKLPVLRVACCVLRFTHHVSRITFHALRFRASPSISCNALATPRMARRRARLKVPSLMYSRLMMFRLGSPNT